MQLPAPEIQDEFGWWPKPAHWTRLKLKRFYNMRELLRQATGAGAPAAVALVVPGDCAAPQLVPGVGAPAPQIQQGLKGLALAPLQLHCIGATFRRR